MKHLWAIYGKERCEGTVAYVAIEATRLSPGPYLTIPEIVTKL